MLRFEPCKNDRFFIRIWVGGNHIASIVGDVVRVEECSSGMWTFTASDLRQIADELDELNGTKS